MSKVKLLEEVNFLRFWSAWHPEVHSNVITALSSLTALGGVILFDLWPLKTAVVFTGMSSLQVRCFLQKSDFFTAVTAGVLPGIAILTKTGDHCVLSYGKLASHSDQASNRHESRFFALDNATSVVSLSGLASVHKFVHRHKWKSIRCVKMTFYVQLMQTALLWLKAPFPGDKKTKMFFS